MGNGGLQDCIFRVGHLFQSSYKARVVDADEYLIQLVRYIDLNDEIVRVVCERCGVEEDDISASGNDRRLAAIRRTAAWAVREHGNESIAVLAKRLNRDLSTLSRGATMVAAKAKRDPALLRQLSDIREALS